MNGPLRVLHLEDDPDYCDLVHSLLVDEGYQVKSVLANDRASFEAALARPQAPGQGRGQGKGQGQAK